MFYNQTIYTTGSGPASVALADVNSDNNLDIITANNGATTVSVLFNAGNGTFLNQSTYTAAAGAPTPRSVFAADVNGDNKPDILVSNSGTNNVGILLNKGDGTFLNGTTYITGAGATGPRAALLFDVNGDNKPDIISANTGTNNIGVLLNGGNGTFLSAVTYTAGATSAPRGVTVADLNGDSLPDIIAADTGAANVGVFINTGGGTFRNGTTYTTGPNPYQPAIGDVNGDNKPDIIVPNNTGATVSVLLNAGNGTFLT